MIPTLETPRPMLWIVDQKMIGGDVQCGSEGVQVGVPLRPPMQVGFSNANPGHLLEFTAAHQ